MPTPGLQGWVQAAPMRPGALLVRALVRSHRRSSPRASCVATHMRLPSSPAFLTVLTHGPSHARLMHGRSLAPAFLARPPHRPQALPRPCVTLLSCVVPHSHAPRAPPSRPPSSPTCLTDPLQRLAARRGVLTHWQAARLFVRCAAACVGAALLQHAANVHLALVWLSCNLAPLRQTGWLPCNAAPLQRSSPLQLASA